MRRAAAAANVVDFELPSFFEGFLDLTWRVTHFEYARPFASYYWLHPETNSNAVAAERAILYERYIEGLKTLESLRNEMQAVLDGFERPDAEHRVRATARPWRHRSHYVQLSADGAAYTGHHNTAVHRLQRPTKHLDAPRHDDRLLIIARWVELHVG